MAQYKVPQDVEAEDKLLGPFTFRQFIYLIITVGSAGMSFAFFQIFPLLAIIPLPITFFFAILALPLKKDQPMETYLAAIVSFYLKPRKHIWLSGQRESTILITAPKKVEKSRTRNITEEEASHRLSFLAEIVDSEGYSIHSNSSTTMQPEVIAEANSITDIFDSPSPVIAQIIQQEQVSHHNEILAQMRTAIERAESIGGIDPPNISKFSTPSSIKPLTTTPASSATVSPLPDSSPVISPSSSTPSTQSDSPTQPNIIPTTPPSSPLPIQPNPSPDTPQLSPSSPITLQVPPEPDLPNLPPSQDMIALANNPNYSVQTIQQEAERINNKKGIEEVFISLH